MGINSRARICVVPRMTGIGGMVTFREKLVKGLEARSVEVVGALEDWPYDAILVIGGTRQILTLSRARWKGVRIVHRLDGMNWFHRRLRTGWRHSLRAEYGNFILGITRSRLAHHVVYQSEFVRGWWERVQGSTRISSDVIYNGVDLEFFKPEKDSSGKTGFKLLLVEGSLLGGYEYGLEMAAKLVVEIARQAQMKHSQPTSRGVELVVAGKVARDTQARWESWIEGHSSHLGVRVNWLGAVPHSEIPVVHRSANLFFSSDLNPACPNSVIESMACATPVVAFDTGSLPELIADSGGKVVPYGGDPWKLDPPDIPALALAALSMLEDIEHYQSLARIRAEGAFDVNFMVDRYLEVLLPAG